jgi:Luciferase-like monooxygenase
MTQSVLFETFHPITSAT